MGHGTCGLMLFDDVSRLRVEYERAWEKNRIITPPRPYRPRPWWSRLEQRAFIKVQVLLGFGAADIHRQLVGAVGLGGALPSRTVKRWVHFFRKGREETAYH